MHAYLKLDGGLLECDVVLPINRFWIQSDEILELHCGLQRQLPTQFSLPFYISVQDDYLCKVVLTTNREASILKFYRRHHFFLKKGNNKIRL